MPSAEDPDLVVLAGGRSTRMGADKTELPIAGAPLLARLAQVGLDLGMSVRVVGRERPPWWTLSAVGFAVDDTPGDGPLGGLATALRGAARPLLLVACDMPAIDAAALRWLIACWRGTSQPHGCVATLAGALEPLFAIYAPACLPLVDAGLASGRRALHGVIADGDFARCAVPPSLILALTNLNTPDDLATWRQPLG